MQTTIESFAAAWNTAPKSVLPSQRYITGAHWVCAGGKQTGPHVSPLLQDVHVVTLVLRGFTGECWVDGKVFHTGRVAANRLRVVSSGHAPSWRADSPVEMFHVYIPDVILRRQLAVLGYVSDMSVNALRATNYMSDPLLHSVMCRLAGIVRVDGRLQERYLQSLEDALLLHLLHHYGDSACLCRDAPLSRSSGMQTALESIAENLSSHLSVGALANIAGISTAQFNRNFFKATGFTPHQYRLQLRIDAAKAKLSGGTDSLTTIADELGFADQAHFTRTFRQFTGMPPGEFVLRHAQFGPQNIIE